MKQKFHDYLFVGTILIAIVLMSLNVYVSVQQNTSKQTMTIPNMPRIEQNVLEEGIRSGRLSDKKARFYKVIKP